MPNIALQKKVGTDPPDGKRGTLSAASILFMLIVSVVLCFFSTEGWTLESEKIEERLLRMEREIQRLKQKNANLEREIQSLREQIAPRQGPAEDIFEETISRPDAAELPCELTDPEEKPETSFRLGYKNGLDISSEDDRFKLRLGGRVAVRFTGLDSGHPSHDEFSVEKARLYAKLTLLEHYDLKIQTEFSRDPTLKDAYLNIHHVPWAQLQMGQFKTPYTWENLFPFKYHDFAERSIAVNNMRRPTRDIGLMLHGRLFYDRFGYQFAVLNGSGENKGDDNDGKDIVGRLTIRPFRDEVDGVLPNLHLGVSGTFGDQDKDYSNQSFRTAADTKFVDFATGTMHTGDRIRLGTEAIWLVGPASIKAEWTRMRLNDFELASLEEDFDFYGWYVSASYLLTGEEKTLGRISPARPFDPSKGMWGAWELVARYSVFRSDSDLFRMAMATGTDRADTASIGLNWYLNDFMRMLFDYEYTDFDDTILAGGEKLDDEHALMVQFQLAF